MPQKEIEVILSESGEAVITVKNAVGKECESLTGEIEEALGKTTSKTKTRDYYKAETRQQQEQRQ